MNPDHHTTFRKIGDVLARQVIPELHCAARFPLRVSYIGVAGFDGCDEADSFERANAAILDRERALVLAGAIRAGIILWQQPVGSNAEARRVVADASRLRGRAFAAEDRGERVSAREFRFCAAMLEARLVDLAWRETAADLLRLPQAA